MLLQLMSHGERTPSEGELEMLGTPPSDHVFAPYGAGAMTNVSFYFIPEHFTNLLMGTTRAAIYLQWIFCHSSSIY